MRLRVSPVFFSLIAALSLSLLVALSLPGRASADPGNGKLDKRLVAQQASVSPDAAIKVIVTGPGADLAIASHGAKKGAALDLVSGVSATVNASDLDALASDPSVSFVSADVPVAPTGTPDPSMLATLYPLLDGAPAAWSKKLDGNGVGVAVIDSGVRKQEDFANLKQIPVPGLSLTDDSYGHGTLVAGVLAGRSKDGRYVGVAPGASLFSLDINRPDGVRSSDVIAALGWVFDNAHKYNIRVVNLSLQETVASSYQQSVLDLAVERLWAAGIVVVAGAGNNGPGLIDFAPANDPLALTVGAADSNDTLSTLDDTVASFSSAGLTVDGFAKPELYAPGRHIVSTLPLDTTLGQQAPAANQVAPGYTSISGTSFAAPQASGAAALLFQQHPDWSPDQVKWLLQTQSQPLAGSSAGALSVMQALAYSGAPSLANQGVPALVCAPGSTCVVAGPLGTIASSWNSSSWNMSSWNMSSWNMSSWNMSSWNMSSWNMSSWNMSSWNMSSWNMSSWNMSSWNMSSWNMSSWNMSSWNFSSWN